jgi:hypothetical protein
MKYDDASWHYGGDFPEDLDSSAGATHIGMFLAWALLSDLGGTLHTEEFPNHLARLRDRVITPGQYLISVCDEKFTDEDLNDQGNEFAEAYYESESESDSYIADYEQTLADELPSAYHVADTWDNFDKMKPVIDRRLSDWMTGR